MIFFSNLTKQFPVIITGGIITQLLTIEEKTFPYTIHILNEVKEDKRDKGDKGDNEVKEVKMDIGNLLSEIHNYIINIFKENITFKENNMMICYSCIYHLQLNKFSKTTEEALKFETLDFCRIGYKKEGFITDHIGQIALSNRIHFTTEDMNIPYFISDIGFRTIVSKKFIVETIVQRKFI